MSRSLKTLIRAGLLGLALAGSAVTAMPAQAASPSFSFDFHVGGPGHFRPHHPVRHCLSDREVRRLLRHHGYEDIRFIDRRGRTVSVRAERGRHHYRVTIDSCRGRIIDVDRLRRR